MNFVESLNLFGVPAKEIPCIKGSGAPSSATAGAVGLFYMNTDNGDVYKCTAAADGVYTWAAINADLTSYATEQFVREGYQPKGNYLSEVPAGYAKSSEIPTKPADIGAQPAGNYALKTEIPVVPVQSVNGKTGTVNLSASDVGADSKGAAEAAVSQHNTADDSHNDIRLELKAINDRLTAFFDSDNQTLDELSEIVAYITSNKSLIDSITTSKVSVADIINNLTTNVSNKPLSAAQGVVLKGLIDTLSNNLANYQPKGDYALRSELPTVPVKVSAFENDKGYLTQHQDISGKVDKTGLTLGIHSDGLYYIFVDGAPVGSGFELSAGGDVFGVVDANNNIVLNGNLPDGTYSVKYEMENGNTVNIGNLVLDTNVYYTVTNNLTQCTNSNSATQAVQGGSYSATITAKSGYELKSIVVKMGGTDISSTAVSGSTITIANVTGNIVITATATEIVASYTNLAKNFTTGRFNSSGAVDASTTAATACTDYIGPLEQGDIIRIKGFGACQDYNTQWANASKSNDSCSKLSTTSSHYSYSYDSTTGIVTLTKTDAYAGCTYCRISGKLTGTTADVIITLNEPIV